MKVKELSIFFGIVATFVALIFVTSGSATLETQRLSDHCIAIYGYDAEQAAACQSDGDSQLVLANDRLSR